MSNIDMIVASSILNSISKVKLNRENSVNSEQFGCILNNALMKLSNLDGGNHCCKNFNNGDILNTGLGDFNQDRINKPKININNSDVNMSYNISDKTEKAIKLLEGQVGKPYVWGGNGPDSFDCSGLTRYIYKNALGKDIPRVSYDQSNFGEFVEKRDLQPGDLVFFDTMKKGRVSHVGIYIGNGEFIHAANEKDGVIKSKLSGYYEKTYKGARRP